MSANLITEPNLPAPDDFYQALVDMHQDLTDEQSQLANTRLIFLLANQIGNMDVLRAAVVEARAGVEGPVDMLPRSES